MRHGVTVVDATPDELAPALADAYLELKAGRAAVGKREGWIEGLPLLPTDSLKREKSPAP